MSLTPSISWRRSCPCPGRTAGRGPAPRRPRRLPSSVPIVKIENPAVDLVSYSASAAAIFIGCTSVITLAWRSPGQGDGGRGSTSTMIAPSLGRRSGTRRCRRLGVADAAATATTPSTNRTAGQERGEDRVREGDQGDLVGQHGPDVGQLDPAGVGLNRVADRVLHERVGGEDEVRGEHGAEGGEPDRHQVQLRRQPVPAEDPQAEEGGLEEEGQQSLDGQGCAEDVADEPRVVAPVHPELELLHDAGDHTHGEVDQEQLPEELRQPQVAGPSCVRYHAGLEPGDDEGTSPMVSGHEEEVVHRRDPELPSGRCSDCLTYELAHDPLRHHTVRVPAHRHLCHAPTPPAWCSVRSRREVSLLSTSNQGGASRIPAGTYVTFSISEGPDRSVLAV